MALLALAHVFVRQLNRTGAREDSLTDGLASSVCIGSVFSVVMLAYPAILYVIVDKPGGLVVAIARDTRVLVWVVAGFVAGSCHGAFYFVRSYRPYRQ